DATATSALYALSLHDALPIFLSKLVVHAHSRAQAIQKMDRALSEYKISGLRTTIPFCRFVMHHDKFKEGVYDTHFIKDHYDVKSDRKSTRLNSSHVKISYAVF